MISLFWQLSELDSEEGNTETDDWFEASVVSVLDVTLFVEFVDCRADRLNVDEVVIVDI